MSNYSETTRRWRAARLNFYCTRDRAVFAAARGETSIRTARRAVARAERSLREQFRLEVKRASELPVYRAQVDPDAMRDLPRIAPPAWVADDPARHALYRLARRTADMMNDNLEGADAGVCCYGEGFLTVEWLRDGEPLACALAHDREVLIWL